MKDNSNGTAPRVVLISGASRGLGLEIARAFARGGARLVLTARNDRALDAAADELCRSTDVVALAGDVADPAPRARLVQAALDRFSQVDALINNASELGPSPMPELADYPTAALRQVIDVNVIAPLALA